MAKTDAQKRATKKWDYANRKTISCTISIELLDRLDECLAECGKTRSGMLKDAIHTFVEKFEKTP